LGALQAELGGSSFLPVGDNDGFDSSELDNDPYAKYYEDEEAAEDEAEQA